MRLIDGRAIAAGITAEAAATLADLAGAGITPTLAVVVPTDDEATAWYVRSIERAAVKLGVVCRVVTLSGPDVRAITQQLDALSADPAVHGIICQTPLPRGVTLDAVGAHIDPAKDIDGANPVSLGRLAAGLPTYPPATARAVLEILRREEVRLTGRRVVVVGRSTVVGKPVALLMLKESATVTVCHSQTVDLASVCADADVLVAATGRPHLLGAAHIKPGAIIVDVGTTPADDGSLLGDVDRAGATAAAALTPVPGGVGPVTTAVLMAHVVAAAGR